MLRSTKSIHGMVVRGREEDLGTIKDHLFDDRYWVVRYVVVDTGTWLPGRKVVVPPLVMDPLGPGDKEWSTPLLKKQIKQSPSLSEQAPVSRQFEQDLHTFFDWKPYWSMPNAGLGWLPGTMPPEDKTTTSKELTDELVGKPPEPHEGDRHLRSAEEVVGYHIEARDGEIGHIEDFILDVEDSILRYFVIDTRNWLPGRKVLISTDWIDSIRWSDQVVKVDLTRDEIENSPPFDPGAPVNRGYETSLFDYYGRRKYWAEQPMPAI